jgi:hypothetical protein
MKEVSIGEIKQQPMGIVLDKIAHTGDFNFAYNNKTIPADSIVSVTGYRGTLFSLLDKLLGKNYEFKEVPGYIVLRHAPNKLFITAEVEKDPSKQTVVKGYVNDVSNQKEVTQASVYEKNLLISTLTDDKGYFELKLKNWNGSLLLTVSKENYRDTSLYVLPVVNVDSKNSNRNYKYYPEDGSESGVEHSRFARFFISSKQLMQGLNLGNFFASRPYQISLTPGLSSHGMYNSQVVNHLSLNIWGGYTAGVNGVEMAGLFNINRKDMTFFQASGIFNFVGGSTKGIQLTAAYNNVMNNARGLQVAGLVNRANNFTSGVQLAGLANIDQQANGVQLAGLLNTSGKSTGIQFAGVLNHSAGETGSQFSAIINIAKKVKGIQFALINIADSSDHTIGFLNFIKDGEKSLSMSTDEALLTHLNFRSGGKVFYSLFGVGYKFTADENRYALDIGFGAHVVNHSKFILNGEYISQLTTDTKKKFYQTNSLQLLPGYKLSKTLRLYAGPSINLTSADISDEAKVYGWILNKHINNNHINTLFVGVTGGLQFVW